MQQAPKQRSGKIVVPREHLHPTIQEYVGDVIRERRVRLGAGGTLAALAAAPAVLKAIDPATVVPTGVKAGSLGLAGGVVAGTRFTGDHIAQVNSKIGEHIRENGIEGVFDKRKSRLYNSLKPSIESTHSVAYVNLRGDLVFVKRSKSEGAKLKKQESGIRRQVRLHPWRYRIDLTEIKRT